MKTFQKAGGISALGAAATYLFAMGMAATVLNPMMVSTLSIQDYMSFLMSNRILVFIWHFSMYLVNGLCLIVLAFALYERLKSASLRLAAIGAILGFIWAVFVFLSGLITIYSNESLVVLSANQPALIEPIKRTLDMITSGIDSSDKFLGCLWVGLSSLAAFRNKIFPKAINLFGMVIGSAGLIGTLVPVLGFVSYAFGVGAIIWWLAIGILMLRNQEAGIIDKTPVRV